MEFDIGQKELRYRAERLLGGERRQEDLTALFLSQRDKAHPQAPEREIGDFIAHRDVRTQGESHVKTRAFVSVIDVNFSGGLASLDEKIAALRWAFEVQPPEIITSEMGMGADKHDALRSMLGRIVAKGLGQKNQLTEREKKLARLLRKLAPPYVFTPEQLVKSFADNLVESRIIKIDEVSSFLNLEKFISLFAVYKMHGSQIHLENGRTAQIIVHVGDPDISTWAGALFGKTIYYLAHFRTGLKGADHAPEIFNKWQDKSVYEPIELNDEGKLIIMNM